MTTDPSSSWLVFARRACVAAWAAGAMVLAQAATIVVVNTDGPGVGFNDPAPAAPVGGNAGTTLGEQRQIVFAFASRFWGSRLRSDVPIQVLASFSPLPCTATNGVLGSAGAWNVFFDFPNGRPATWYPSALANKLAGVPLFPHPDPFESADLRARFNGALGNPGCLEGLSFYLGLDGNAAPNQIDLLTTVLHEFGHGLGFQTFTDDETGAFFPGPGFPEFQFPSIWDYFLFDPKQHKHWADMTDAERATSAITPRNLVWSGRNVTANAGRVLDRGTPELFVAGGGLNKLYMIGVAEFGPPIDKRTLVSSEMALVAGPACTPLDPAAAAAVRRKVAVIDRGSCFFTVKVKNAQDAGAKAVLIADNMPGSPPLDMPGVDPTITIPSARVTLDDGIEIKNAIATTPPRRLGPFAVLFSNQLKLAGADYFQRVYMYTPNPLQPGSSVSHYDTLAKPNQLMEPFLNDDQAIAVEPPDDLTLPLFVDLGW